jgi:hypothetical protein
MLSKMGGKKVKVRPLARRFNEVGGELDPRDDLWIIQDVCRARINLLNVESNDVVPLGTDHVREYLSDVSGQSDGFLTLKSEILIQSGGISVEPLNDRGRPLRSVGKGATVHVDDLDDALRFANGIVIEGPAPLLELQASQYAGINISAFTAYLRAEATSVSYNSGSISGLALGTTYYVYAIDPRRKGGAVTYMATPVRYKALAGDEKIYIGRMRTPVGHK